MLAGAAGVAVVVGHDGFVDLLLRSDGETLTGLGAWVAGCSGRNGLRPVRIAEEAGGCAVNLGDALAALGVQVHAFATLGEPRHGAFAAFAGRCRSCASWGAPGSTVAIEARDGKAMLSDFSGPSALVPARVRAGLADGAYAAACARAAGIAWCNWSLYPAMTAIWELLWREVLAGLPRRHLLVDLVDPSARSDGDLQGMLALLRTIAGRHAVCLSLNLAEAARLARCAGAAAPQAGDLAGGAAALRRALDLPELLLHNRDGDAVAWEGGVAAMAPLPRCERPVKSTGAGDRFNAGWLLGRCLGLERPESLRLGQALAGAFMRRGVSAGRQEVESLLPR